MGEAVGERVRHHPLWYHVLDLGEAGTTRGWFDLRPVLHRLPWPDVAGKRCLDVGTYDGFLAFEMEARGASEVVATDIGSHHDWDWPPRARDAGVAYLDSAAGGKGDGFRLAREALGSRVEREVISVYDLAPERLGSFDVVTCGSLLLHLRDPLRALAAIRGVCGGELLSCEPIDAVTTVLHPRRPVVTLNGERGQWANPNAAAHFTMLDLAGFDVLERSRPYAIPFGPGHPGGRRSPGERVAGRLRSLLAGGDGVLHVAGRCRPARGLTTRT